MNEALKVLHTEWSDGWGGQEIRIISEMTAIRAMGIEVFLACRNDSKIKHAAVNKEITVFVLPFRGNTDLKTLFSLKKIIKDYSIDIVNTHSGKDTWVGGLAAKMAGVKFIRTRHLSNKINPSRLNFINELADHIFTTGEKIKDEMIKYNRIPENKITSIPTGINEAIFNPENYKTEDCRRKFNLSDGEIAIGILAVLRQFKRHDLFLLMAKELIKKFPEKKFVFIIAGAGPQKQNIQNLVDQLKLFSSVKMVGHVSNPAELLSALDILVLCSDSKEGVPQSVMQGLFMNKAVIATDIGGTSDLFHKNNFQLIEKDSIDGLVKSTSICLENINPVSTRGHMMKYFSLSVMVEKIMNSYEKILE